MTELDVLAFKYRAKLIIDNLRNCNSGAEVHEVGNMRHTAQGVLDALEHDPLDCQTELIAGILGRVEAQEVAFFKKKFESAAPTPFCPYPIIKPAP